MISALNVSGLRKLRLLKCKSVARFLEAITEAKTNLQLQSFEVEVFDKDTDDKLLYDNTISTFLASFQGLGECYIYTDLVHRPKGIWVALSCHRMTLKQLVLFDKRHSAEESHQRTGLGTDSSALYGLFTGGWQYAGQISLLESVGLGTSCLLDALSQIAKLRFLDNVKLLRLKGPREYLMNEKLIEYRLSTSYNTSEIPSGVLKVARWAFGPLGLPKLRILACGDPFSNDIAYGDWMLSRNATSPKDPELFQLTSLTVCEDLAGIAKSFEVLSACQD